MKSSQIYRKAAELVDSDQCEFSCSSITYQGRFHNERRIYIELFSPPRASYVWGDMWSKNPDKVKNCRVLALLLMAAISESEGD